MPMKIQQVGVDRVSGQGPATSIKSGPRTCAKDVQWPGGLRQVGLSKGWSKLVQAVMACAGKVGRLFKSLGFAPGFQVVMHLTPLDVRGG